MTLTLELPPEIEQALQTVAQVEGEDPAHYAVHVLALHLAPVAALQRAGHLTSTPPAAAGGASGTTNGLQTPVNQTDSTRKLELLDAWEQEVSARPDYRAEAGLGPLPDNAVEDAYHAREDTQL